MTPSVSSGDLTSRVGSRSRRAGDQIGQVVRNGSEPGLFILITRNGEPRSYLGVSINGGTPSSHPFIDGIFHEINHPAIKGITHWKNHHLEFFNHPIYSWKVFFFFLQSPLTGDCGNGRSILTTSKTSCGTSSRSAWGIIYSTPRKDRKVEFHYSLWEILVLFSFGGLQIKSKNIVYTLWFHI